MAEAAPRCRRVTILAYPGAQPIDIAGPLQAFVTADEEVGGGAYRVETLALPLALAGAGAVMLSGGLPILAASAPPRAAPDTLLVPGGPGVHAARRDAAAIATLRRLAARSRRICSVCTGAFLLAEAGLLDGREAATHWRACGRLAAEFPAVRVRPDPIWLSDGPVWTSAGVTAGIDLALALVEEDLGTAVALRVARRLVVYMRRPGGQAQFSTPLAVQAADGFAPLLDWVAANLHRPLPAEELARQAGMSPRSFHRHFLARTGETPARAIERMRLEQARALMETTAAPLGEVARRSGFGREERLRRAFARSFGVAPAEWRQRFAAGLAADGRSGSDSGRASEGMSAG
jgi:transcriptional regulator GlxA family with amidase domain